MKDQLLRPKFGSVVEFHARINKAVVSVTPQTLGGGEAGREIEYPVRTFCELQMTFTLSCTELGEFK
jgi:hypothetical protein